MKKRIIGIAGYMGAGKSQTAQLLAGKDDVVINADKEAKALMNSSQEIRYRLRTHFGSDVIMHSGIDFARLGDRVFIDKSSLLKLNRIVHPALIRELSVLLNNSAAAMTTLDAALLPLWSMDDAFDHLIWVDASHNCRFERLSRKAVLPRDQLEKRMHLQEEILSPPQQPGWHFFTNTTNDKIQLADNVAQLRSRLSL
ncbi:MAG: dephospho-CoA kinase [Chitinivibrionales bacterium]|nr:dephospho-CoA kinase [Chitinivibrionales bacterium]